MFDWNDLRYFLELARQGRLAPAAKRLHVDHSTVGRRIAELEKALDAKLFDRAPNGFVLTEAGHRLLAYAESIEVNTIAIAETSGQAAALSGSVRLATMEGLASFYLASRLVEFYDTHPGITVELITSTQLLSLTKREADVSLSCGRSAGSTCGFTRRRRIWTSTARRARSKTCATIASWPISTTWCKSPRCCGCTTRSRTRTWCFAATA
jgi:DNA-binding transcriptional LysR family regulator